MTTEMQHLIEIVHKQETVMEGAVTLLNSIGKRITDNAEDAEAMKALGAELNAEGDKLAAAIAANTPAAPAAPATTTTAPAAESGTGTPTTGTTGQ